MRKTFSLTHEKIKTPRLVDAIKHDIKKYLKRERKKQLPNDADYWDFDCKFGKTKETADIVHVSQLNKCVSEAEVQGLDTFYLEIIAKPATRNTQITDTEIALDEDE